MSDTSKPEWCVSGTCSFAVLGQESQWASEASECAREQQAFWAYHDKLHASQQGKDQGALKSMTSELGLDTARFSQCLDAGKYAGLVARETDAGKAIGIRATPTFLVNGQLIQGTLPFVRFQEVIDAAHEEARQR